MDVGVQTEGNNVLNNATQNKNINYVDKETQTEVIDFPIRSEKVKQTNVLLIEALGILSKI